MNALTRRNFLRRCGGVGLALGATALGAGRLLAQDEEGRVIEMEARRFRFTPNEITVRRGEAVTLAIRSIDFTHGFSLPDLGLRSDLIPGKVTRIKLTPTRAGKFTFLCDNFCGDGHENMNGILIVET
jgi:cytochrome c oxidase subunit II